MIMGKWRNLSRNLMRYIVNDGPARLINGSYNAYSMLYRGQLSLGLPVSRELIVSQKEIRTRAVQKLALVLYHVFLNATCSPIPRDDIKAIISDELKKGRLRLTEKCDPAHRSRIDRPLLKTVSNSQETPDRYFRSGPATPNFKRSPAGGSGAHLFR